jgi:hypothetical protein
VDTYLQAIVVYINIMGSLNKDNILPNQMEDIIFVDETASLNNLIITNHKRCGDIRLRSLDT